MTLLKTVKKALAKIPTSTKLVVGVSGGADSVALAFLLRKLGYPIVMAHLNHGLRGKESDADQALVESLAKRWKVPFLTEKVDLRKLKPGNRENELRSFRYAFLEKARQKNKARFVAVAHHRDDQIETILMHMARGAGLRGIRGMSPIQGHVIRPLLDIPKQDLADLLDREQIPFRTDQSNFDTNLRRNHFRHRIIPILKSEWPTLEKDLLAFAKFAQAETQKREKIAILWMRKNVIKKTFGRKAFLKLPDAIQSEILFELVGRKDLYRKAVEKTKTLLLKGVTGKQKKLGSLVFKIQYDQIVFFQEEGRNPPSDKPEPITKNTQWGRWNLKNLGPKALFVRVWKPGDRLKPAGMQGSKKLQDLFVDLKIPKAERHQIPIITDAEERILAVGNLRFARNAGNLKKYLKIEHKSA